MLFLLLFFLPNGEPQTLVHMPSLSPDGQNVAFSFQGDIWTYNRQSKEVQRLTIHPSYESNPVWNPDGSQIAFSSTREGQQDVFCIPSQGGAAVKKTFHRAGDTPTYWNAEGIWFNTNRIFRTVERDFEIYLLKNGEGTPSRALDAVGRDPQVSPDGRFIAFTRGSCRLERERYEGPANRDVWVFDRKKETFQQLTTSEGNDFCPRWIANDQIVFLGLNGGRYNLMQMNIESQSPTEITKFEDEGIIWMDANANGIVFERGGKLSFMQSGGEPSRLDIQIGTDSRTSPVRHEVLTGDMSQFALSPDEKWVAFIANGDVFITENDKEKSATMNLTQSAARERSVVWLDEDTLLFDSDRHGQYDLFSVQSDDPEKSLLRSLKRSVKRVLDTPEDESNLLITPDRKKVLFLRGRGQLVMAEVSGTVLQNEKVLIDGWAIPEDLAVSPDSRWLAFTYENLHFNPDVMILPLYAPGKPINVSMHPRGDHSPFWSADGSKLGFSSIRNNSDDDVWFAWLRREDWEKTKEDRELGWYFADPDEEDEEEKDEDSDKEKKDKDAPQLIEIDLDGIHERLIQVTSMAGDERGFGTTKDGKTFYFTADAQTARGSDIFKTEWDKAKISSVTKGGQNPQAAQMAKKDAIYFIKSGKLKVVKKDKVESRPHKGLQKIDEAELRQQILDEAWRALDAGFYDPEFHGQDWHELKKTYASRALAEASREDFRTTANQMLGQLNASHMGIYDRGGSRGNQAGISGVLGIETEGADIGLRITYVLPQSPASKAKSKLNAGDTILAVNGHSLGRMDNLYHHLAGLTDEEVMLEVKNEQGEIREVVIRPTNSLSTEGYEAWVGERRQLVEKYSDGKLGYLHIRGMNMSSFERFERDLMASGYGKEGIVIDVRFNGGGWTTDYLMAVLNVRQHAYTIPRGATDSLKNHKEFKNSYPFSERLPLASWTKPSIALCNQNSYSNAEIFSHAFKTLGHGTLVGTPTFGAVISTGGYLLQDGFFVRMPYRAWFVKATEENMEHGPAVPDIIIDNEPNSRAKGEDPQLKKAVDTLLGQLSDN